MFMQKLNLDRRSFIGGSDARAIMGSDEAALLRLWREKRGEIEPEDLSDNLIVQLGSVTEDLNRRWYERNTGYVARARHIVSAVKRTGVLCLLDKVEVRQTKRVFHSMLHRGCVFFSEKDNRA